MANNEDISRLKAGVDEWNTWRKKNPEIQPDLRDADLSRANLIGANLNGADLYGAKLDHAKIGTTTFGNNDLGVVEELDLIEHLAPSTIGTLIRSTDPKAKFPNHSFVNVA